jgi:hypothetical protein
MEFETPDGPLDLREFVRTPEDLAVRASEDVRLAGLLADHPPRYELRRQVGVGAGDEETELRREIVAFGSHPHVFRATVRANDHTPARTVRRLLRTLRRSECAPLFAVDAALIGIRPVSGGANRRLDADAFRGGESVELESCEPVRLTPGRHRIESLAGLSGLVVTVTIVPDTDRDPPLTDTAPVGTIELTSRSPTRLKLDVEAPDGTLLVGGMPWHRGWVAGDGALRRFPVPLDTFAAWTVENDERQEVTLQFGPQRWYELALALSAATSVWCAWRVTRRKRGRS